MNKHDKDGTKGEGDRASARRYDQNVREFIAEGRVPDAASKAREYLDRDPEGAQKSEQRAKRGPHGRFVSLDQIVAKGQSVIGRVRPMVERAVGRARARFTRK